MNPLSAHCGHPVPDKTLVGMARQMCPSEQRNSARWLVLLYSPNISIPLAESSAFISSGVHRTLAAKHFGHPLWLFTISAGLALHSCPCSHRKSDLVTTVRYGPIILIGTPAASNLSLITSWLSFPMPAQRGHPRPCAPLSTQAGFAFHVWPCPHEKITGVFMLVYADSKVNPREVARSCISSSVSFIGMLRASDGVTRGAGDCQVHLCNCHQRRSHQCVHCIG